jgi:haloalkane dehalogenase
VATRPAWVNQELLPFESHFAEVDGARIHYIDEGQGPVFLGLHGNPTWSFLYRHIVNGLKHRFRCIAPDYPGFGLSTAPPGYRYTIAEHSRVVESFVTQLGLEGITLMVQDWGGPIGLSVAVRHPERFRALVIGNTWGWPVRGEKTFERFSKLLGSSFPGGLLVERLDLFTNVFVPGGVKRRKLSGAEKAMYKAPHPTPASRVPVHVMPREILAAHELLSEVEQGLPRGAHLPALIVWGDRDQAFKEPQRLRWERTFPNHKTVILRGASHDIQEDAPEEIVAAIQAWWPGEQQP